MTSLRPQRLARALVCLRCLLAAGLTLPAQQQTQPPATPPPTTNPNNPFENIPQSTPATPARRPPSTPPANAPATPQTQPPANPAIRPPQFENPTPAQPAAPAAAPGETLAPDVIEGIDFRGSRRVPQDTLKALIFERVGDVYSEENMRRDYMAL